jgi:hypothetical protein
MGDPINNNYNNNLLIYKALNTINILKRKVKVKLVIINNNILEVAAKHLQGNLIFKQTLHVPWLNFVL